MLLLIVALFLVEPLNAEILEAVEYRFHRPIEAPSCGLLKHREVERLKVIRELKHSTSLLLSNNLLINKLFMPSETWRDLTGEVEITVKMPESMVSEIENVGFGQLFLVTRGPGFVWQSLAHQIPDGMSIQADLHSRLLHIRYLTYLNVICLGQPEAPVIEWVPSDSTPPNSSWELIQISSTIFPLSISHTPRDRRA